MQPANVGQPHMRPPMIVLSLVVLLLPLLLGLGLLPLFLPTLLGNIPRYVLGNPWVFFSSGSISFVVGLFLLGVIGVGIEKSWGSFFRGGLWYQ